METVRRFIKSEFVHEVQSGNHKGLKIYETHLNNTKPVFFTYKQPSEYFESVKDVINYLDNRQE